MLLMKNTMIMILGKEDSSKMCKSLLLYNTYQKIKF